jgi:hypothetical protein
MECAAAGRRTDGPAGEEDGGGAEGGLVHAPWIAHGMRYVEILLLELFFFAGCFCKYPNAQFTSTGNGRPISSMVLVPLLELRNPISGTALNVCFLRFLALFSHERVWVKTKHLHIHHTMPLKITYFLMIQL